MGFPNSLSSYPDVQELFDKALASTKGLRLRFDDPKQAKFNWGRMHAYRVRLKRENARIYPADHHLYNNTPYDCLMIQLKDKEVKIEKLAIGRYNVEDLL